MALRAGYYGLKQKLFEKVLGLPAIKSIGDGLSLNSSTGVLSATGGGGTTVVANPEGTATEDLEKLQVGTDIYGIPEGTEVTANPSGTATADLKKLQVGDTIYGISDTTEFIDFWSKFNDGQVDTYKLDVWTINKGDAAPDRALYSVLDSGNYVLNITAKKAGMYLVAFNGRTQSAGSGNYTFYFRINGHSVIGTPFPPAAQIDYMSLLGPTLIYLDEGDTISTQFDFNHYIDFNFVEL